MTVIRVLTEPGRLDDGARQGLAESLTRAILDVEVGTDNPLARAGIMVLFNEQSADRWAVGGRFDDEHVAAGGRLLVFCQAMEGVWTVERRRRLLRRLATGVADSLGIDKDDHGSLATCWVLFDQINEGSWGAFGGAFSLLDALDPAGFAEEQKRDALAALGRSSGP